MLHKDVACVCGADSCFAVDGDGGVFGDLVEFVLELWEGDEVAADVGCGEFLGHADV